MTPFSLRNNTIPGLLRRFAPRNDVIFTRRNSFGQRTKLGASGNARSLENPPLPTPKFLLKNFQKQFWATHKTGGVGQCTVLGEYSFTDANS